VLRKTADYYSREGVERISDAVAPDVLTQLVRRLESTIGELAEARRSVGSTRRDADEAHCRSIARFTRCGERLDYALLAPLMSFGARDHCPKRMRCEA
jgi:hypothetical protein